MLRASVSSGRGHWQENRLEAHCPGSLFPGRPRWAFPVFTSMIFFLVVPLLTTAHLGRTFFRVSWNQYGTGSCICHFKVIILFCLTSLLLVVPLKSLPPFMPKFEGFLSTETFPILPRAGQCLELGRNTFDFLFSCSPPVGHEGP